MSATEHEARLSAQVVTTVWKSEAPRIIGRLAKILGDLSLAEEFAQDALVEALEHWPRAGLPENPGAWLMVTAKHRALNALRRGRFFVELGRDEPPPEPHASLADVETALEGTLDEPVQDDVLRLVFVACHPALSRESRVALTLRTVAGLSTAEIARAFLASEPTMAQRLSRAKRTLVEAGASFELPPAAELGARLSAVLEVIYLVFNEGYAATSGEELVRASLCEEALRLGELVVSLAHREPEAHALLALMWLVHARAAARVDQTGAPVLLAAQDRRLWSQEAVARGLASLSMARALVGEEEETGERRGERRGEGEGERRVRGTPGPYALQAEIAACHTCAPTYADTDWRAIAGWYEALAEVAPSPVVALNHALAVARAEGPAVGLDLLDALVLSAGDALAGYHLLPAARAELLEELGRFGEAAEAFAAAAALPSHPRQRERLLSRAEAARRKSG